jgi:hypothetical protein
MTFLTGIEIHTKDDKEGNPRRGVLVTLLSDRCLFVPVDKDYPGNMERIETHTGCMITRARTQINVGVSEWKRLCGLPVSVTELAERDLAEEKRMAEEESNKEQP